MFKIVERNVVDEPIPKILSLFYSLKPHSIFSEEANYFF